MAAMIVGRCCKVAHLISGIKQMHILQPPQSCVSNLRKSIWYGSIFDTPRKETNTNFPQKPKRPAPAFINYLQNVEADIKKDHPDAKRTDIVSYASKMWRELNPEEKSRFAIARKEMYDQYKEDMRHYIENLTPEQIKEEEKKRQHRAVLRQKRARRSLGMPSKPLGAFNHFMSEKFGERCGEDVPTYFKQLIEQWRKMSESEKEVYRRKAHEQKQKYETDIAKWEKEMMAMGRFDVIRKKSLDQLGKAERKSKKKPKHSSHDAHEDDL